jgi:hypothetical protein
LTCFAAAIVAGTGVASDVSRIDFDGAVSGDLSMNFDRATSTWEGDGAFVGPDTPRFSLPQAVTSLEFWSQLIDRSMNSQRAWIGDSRDGSQSVLAILDADADALLVWVGETIEGEPTLRFDLDRTDGGVTSQDVLAETPQRREDAIYYPKAGVVFPGCVVLLCPRRDNIAGGGGDPIWVTMGVSLLALQEGVDGSWTWSVIHDALGHPDAAGWDRVLMPAMNAYYPISYTGPLTEAFLPFVDYLRHQGMSNAPGGQAFLTKASRSSLDHAWTFGPVKKVFEQSGFGLHFHSAAWTPNGYVLSIGDNRVNNEVKRFTCSDWSQYWDDGLWTQQDRFNGAQTYDSGVSQVPANQFWGCVPGSEINTILVGGDVTSGTVFEVAVPADPAATAQFVRRHGQEFGESGSSAGASNTCEWLTRPRPERSTAVLARTRGTLGSSQTTEARLIYSPDGVAFSSCAGLPAEVDKAAIAVLGESSIYLPTYQSPSSVQGIWSIDRPESMVETRPMAVGGGGRNYLMLDDDGDYLNPVSINNVAVTVVQEAGVSGVHPITGEAMHVPTFAPVVRLKSTGATSRRIWDITLTEPTVPIPHGRAIIPMWINVLGNEMARLRVYLRDGAERDNQLFLLAERDQWVRIALVVDMVEEGPFETPQLRIQVADDDDETYDVDVMVAVEGFFIDDIPGYPTPPSLQGDTTIPWDAPERAEVALPSMGIPCSIVIDGIIPAIGVDATMSTYVDEISLAVLTLMDGTTLTMTADPGAATLVATVTPLKGPPVVAEAGGFHIARLDRFWIAAVMTPQGVTVMGLCGGDHGEGVVTVTVGESLQLPVAVVIGGGKVQAPLLIRSVIADASHAFTVRDIMAVLAGRAPCPHDLSGDGQIGTSDLLIVLDQWGVCSGCEADFDRDGVVGVADLLQILDRWGQCQ